MTDEEIREIEAKHQELVVCGNAQHTNFEIRCPDCAVVCDYCTCPWPCDARKLADTLSGLTVPGGDVRERLVESIAGGTISIPGGYADLARDDAESIVDTILGDPALSRAAAPDPEPEWDYGIAYEGILEAATQTHSLEEAQRLSDKWTQADFGRKVTVVRAPKRVWEPLPEGGESE